MKLSEAIRLGAMLGPQAFGRLRETLGGGVVARCAIAAARDACGEPLSVAYPWVFDDAACCPVGGCPLDYNYDTYDVIAHLNDTHRWTREAIADWVESIEQTLSPSEQTKETINV